jgi:hypothetical protein
MWSFKVDYANNRPAPMHISSNTPGGQSSMMDLSDYEAWTTASGGKGFLLSYDYARLHVTGQAA